VVVPLPSRVRDARAFSRYGPGSTNSHDASIGWKRNSSSSA